MNDDVVIMLQCYNNELLLLYMERGAHRGVISVPRSSTNLSDTAISINRRWSASEKAIRLHKKGVAG